MPIYAYRCDDCGHTKDVLQKLSDPVLTICPACGAAAFSKQLTAAGFQLKGSGWYVTDFKGGAAPKTASDKSGNGADDKAGDKPSDKPSDTPAQKTADKAADSSAGTGGDVRPPPAPPTPAT